MTNNNSNYGTNQDYDLSLAYERYFDKEGKLLPSYYSFIYDKSMEAAERYNKDLSWLRSDESLDMRRATARANGWGIGAGYCRCSTKHQDSYEGQIMSCIDRAIINGTIIFPELMVGDKAVTGKKSDRAGLGLVKGWALAGIMTVLVVFSVTRLYRRLHTGLKFIREDVIERGVRVLAVAEHSDSADPQFAMLLNIHMMMAEMQASALPEFVRMGQKSHVENGFLVGACTLGYRPAPVPEAGLTKKGKVKTRPEIVPEVAVLIRRAFERIAGGTSISEACRLYNQEAATLPEGVRRFAIDPRSTTGIMRPEAFHNLLTRKRVTGLWSFGERRNQWLDSKNSTVQVLGPEHEVVTYQSEDLRIVSDELFHLVQQKLAEGTRGRHGPRTGREATLATSLINMYHCSECGHIFHYYGMKYMHCPESTKGTCGNKGTVERETALATIIAGLRERLLDNHELVAEVVRQSRELDAAMEENNLAENIDMLEKAIRRQNAIMHQIELYCGDEGMDTEDQDRYREAKSKKSGFQAELASLKARIAKKREPISENEVLAILGDFDSLLVEAGSGILDLDAKQRAAALIRDLVGGVVKVSFTRLGGRRAFGLGTFTPHPALAIAKRLGLADSTMPNPQPVTVSFRDLPRYANIVDEVYRLYTEEGLSFNAIGKQLGCGSGNAWYAYAHWHISRNLPVPRQRRQAREKIRHEEKSA